MVSKNISTRTNVNVKHITTHNVLRIILGILNYRDLERIKIHRQKYINISRHDEIPFCGVDSKSY